MAVQGKLDKVSSQTQGPCRLDQSCEDPPADGSIEHGEGDGSQ